MSNTAATPMPATARAEDVVMVTTWKVACDGGEGGLGHPRVWLSLAQDTGEATCGYCDRVYRIGAGHADAGH